MRTKNLQISIDFGERYIHGNVQVNINLERYDNVWNSSWYNRYNDISKEIYASIKQDIKDNTVDIESYVGKYLSTEGLQFKCRCGETVYLYPALTDSWFGYIDNDWKSKQIDYGLDGRALDREYDLIGKPLNIKE